MRKRLKAITKSLLILGISLTLIISEASFFKTEANYQNEPEEVEDVINTNEDNETQDWSMDQRIRYSFANLTESNFVFDFSFDSENEASTIPKEGDTFKLNLPTEWMDVANTEEPQNVYAGPIDQVGKNDATLSEDLMGQYEIADGVLTFSFSNFLTTSDDLSQFFGRIQVPVTLKRSIQQTEAHTEKWIVQTYADDTNQEMVLTIPARTAVDWSSEQAGLEFAIENETLNIQFKENADILAGDTATYTLTDERYMFESVNSPVPLLVDEGTIAFYTTNDKKTINLTFSQTIENIDDLAQVSASIPLLTTRSGNTTSTEDEDQWIVTAGDQTIVISKEGGKHAAIKENFQWIDNYNSSKRPAVDAFLNDFQSIQLSATTADGQTVLTYEFSVEELQEIFEIKKLLSADASGDNVYTVSINAGLPTTGVIGETEVNLNWSVVPPKNITNDTNHYLLVTNREEIKDANGKPVYDPSVAQGYYYVETMNYEITFEFRRGDIEELDNNTLRTMILQKFQFYYRYQYDAQEFLDVQLSKAVEGFPFYDQNVKIDIVSQEDSQSKYAQYTLTLANVPLYFLNGYERVYHVDAGKGVTEIGGLDEFGDNVYQEGDRFIVTYENALDGNHYNNTESAYAGGKVIFTLTGETEYTATKQWGDNFNSSNRPDLSFELWRYTDNGSGSYKDASPVRNSAGSLLKLVVSGDEQLDQFAISFASGTAHADASSILLAEGESLPRYDSEGYPYVYFTRETVTYGEGDNQYTQYFGVENAEGKYEDPLPYGTERESDDNSIYNQGGIVNYLSGTVPTSVVKTWKAAAFQTSFDEIEVTMTLQSRIKNDADAQWQDVKTHTFKDFDANFMADLYTDNVNKYDYDGNELEYRWIESSVTQTKNTEDTSDDVVIPIDSNGEFVIIQHEQNVTYRSETTTVLNESTGGYETTITNRPVGTYTYDIDKVWQTTDGNGNTVTLDPNDERLIGASVYANLYIQTPNGEQHLVHRFPMDGKTDIDITEFEDTIDGQAYTIQFIENTPWHIRAEGLPKYNENGQLYVYMVLEETDPNSTLKNYATHYENGFTFDYNYYSKLTNVIGPGGPIIYISKEWVDASDVEHRDQVVYKVYLNIGDAEPQFVEIEIPEENLTLSADDIWWKEVGLPATIEYNGQTYTVQKDKIVVVESKIGVDGPEINYTNEELTALYEFIHSEQDPTPADIGEEMATVPLLLQGRSTSSNEYIGKEYTTQYHRYRPLYSIRKVGDTEFYHVVNQRLGNVELKVTKKWVDTGANSAERIALQKALMDNGATLYFELECLAVQYPDAIDTENGTINIGVEDIPFYNVPKENIPTANPGSYRVAIDLAQEDFTAYFTNLSKYDRTGQTVHYGVKEVVVMDDQEMTLSEFIAEAGIREEAPYYSSETENIYEQHHTDIDEQSIQISNTLSDTKEVVFYKEWLDDYRDDRGERPDISLDIFQVVEIESENGEVSYEITPIYRDYSWSAKETEDDGTIIVDTTGDSWTITFSNLPEYDSQGRPITYYARENMTIDRSTFDYLPGQYAQYNADGNGYQIYGDEKVGQILKEDDHFIIQYTGDPAGTDRSQYLMRESGIFVNQLANKISINGKKLWASLPDGYTADYLPSVTLDLYQYYDGDNEPISEETPYATLTITNWNELQDGSGNYLFRFDYQGEQKVSIEDGQLIVTSVETDPQEIPLYDAEGRRYVYRIEEKIQFADNTLDQDQVYQTQIDTNSYLITNTYSSIKGCLTIEKAFDPNPIGTGEHYPTVTFVLTRSFVHQGTTIKDEAFVAKRSISFEEFTEDGKSSCTFTDLPIYAPNGTKYIYTVTEEAIDGYNVSYSLDGTTYEEGSSIKNIILKQPVTQNWIMGLQFPLVNVSASEPDKVYFKNVYTPEAVTITGNKKWLDNDDDLGLRPNNITLRLYRSAKEQPNQANAIDEYEVIADLFEVEWDPATPNNVWSYKIIGKNDTGELEKYAPNGMPWIYRVEEVLDAPYDQIYVSTPANGVSGSSGASDTNNTIEMADITNSMLTSINTKKNWGTSSSTNNASGNPYIDYQMKITFQLQVKVTRSSNDNGQTWTDASDQKWQDVDDLWKVIGGTRKYPTTLEKDQLAFGPSSGMITFSNIPRAVKLNGKYLEYGQDTYLLLSYRVYESKVEIFDGNTPIDSVDYTIDDNGNYSKTPDQDFLFEANGTNTAVKNTLPVTSLVITKIWNDNDNIYGARPADGDQWITRFIIQRKTDNGEWENLKDDSGNDKIVELRGTDKEKKQSLTVNDLPMKDYILDANKSYQLVTYQYRARELQANATDTGVNNSNVIESNKGTFNGTYEVAYDDTIAGKTQVSNKLITVQENWTKNWASSDGYTKPVTFELKYLKEGTKNEWLSFEIPAKVVLDGKVEATDEANLVYYEKPEWHAIWTDLPQVMPGSETADNGVTIYRAFEVDTTGVYESVDEANRTITNTPTKLQVTKIVDLGNYTGQLDTAYEFTITKMNGDQEDKTYQDANVKYKIGSDTELIPIPFVNGSATFTLKDKEAITFYGLAAGAYKVEEKTTHETLSKVYKVDGENGNIVSIDSNPQTKIPEVEVTNTYEGKIYIEKQGTGKTSTKLADVQFKIEYLDGDQAKTIDDTVCSNTDLLESGGILSTDANGELVFTGLKLGYTYRISEMNTAGGYNQLIEPFKVTLPVLSNDDGGTIDPIGKVGNAYVYTEVKFVVGNNAAMVIPETGGEDFFLPGVIGLGVVSGAAGYWWYTDTKKKKKRKKA